MDKFMLHLIFLISNLTASFILTLGITGYSWFLERSPEVWTVLSKVCLLHVYEMHGYTSQADRMIFSIKFWSLAYLFTGDELELKDLNVPSWCEKCRPFWGEEGLEDPLCSSWAWLLIFCQKCIFSWGTMGMIHVSRRVKVAMSTKLRN